MQTFLVTNDLEKNAQYLDRQRLGKQRVECLQIMKAITNPDYGWQNHPIVNMWRGYEFALLSYTSAICSEWKNRGYKDTCYEKTLNIFKEYNKGKEIKQIEFHMPEWVNDVELHESHKSNLLRKNEEHYSKFGWITSKNLDYKWIDMD